MNTIGNQNGGTNMIRPAESRILEKITSHRLKRGEDVSELQQLFERLFQRQSNRELWQWKYQPPWTQEPYAWVASVGDHIAGHLGAVPLRGQIKGEETLFFQFGDIVLNPDYRSLATYSALNPNQVVNSIRKEWPNAVIYGFAGKQLGHWYTWLTSLDRSTYVELAQDRLLHIPSEGESVDGTERYSIHRWSWDAPELDALWQQQRETVRIGLIRDRTYLQWRYASHPIYHYALFGVYEDGNPIGWMVTGARESSGQWDGDLRIQDCLLPPDTLFRALKRAALDLRIRSLLFWLPANCLPSGIESRDNTWQVLFHSLDKTVSRNFLASRIYYTLGEADEWWW